MINSQNGSEWRRWDLHIHTPFTKLSDAFSGDNKNKEEVWNHYIDDLEKSPVQAFGITDYYSCENYFTLIEKYESKHPKSNKVFFPNIEFRFSEAISKNNDNPNVNIIFDNDEKSCSREMLEIFLSKLKTQGKNSNEADVFCSDLTCVRDFESASITIDDLKVALKQTFGEKKPYLIVFPANNDGIKTTDPASPRKVKTSDIMDKLADLFFGNSKNKDYFLRTDRYEEGKSKPKPVVSGSDAHSFDDLERLEGNVSGHPPTWIKADLTFRGLKQICFEPDARVFIGSEPLIEQRKRNQATKFLSELSIDQVDGYDESNGQWFKNVKIPINPELTVIIGNKGSGKSALVDIIGLLGESRQSEYFSFLSNKGNNKKFKKRGYAENFRATLTWQSTNKVDKKLDENVDITQPESVRYLPQNYFEQLTNEIEIEEFRREIENVVFLHIDETDRMGKSTFAELQDLKTQQNKQETSTLKISLRELNLEIFNLEEKADPLHKKQLEGKLKAKREEMKSLEKAKPTEVTRLGEETEEQKKLSKKTEQLAAQQAELKETDKKTVDVIAQEKTKLQKLTSLKQSISTISTSISSQITKLQLICEDLGLNINLIIKSEININPIDEQINIVQKNIKQLEKDNGQIFTDTFDFSELKSIPDLRAADKHLDEQIKNLKEHLGTPQRKYQDYLEELSKWKNQKDKILGNENDPQPETIKYLEAQITYIDNELSQKLSQKLDVRKEAAKQIFESKKHILEFYSGLKQSVEEKLKTVRTDKFSVDIDASFVLDRNFFQDFLSHISKNRKGPFHGANEPEKVLKDLLSEIDCNDFDAIYEFLKTVLNKMENYKGEKLQIKYQLNDKKKFYNFLFSFDYFSAKYELRSGGKNLNELSPGEKGLLLLIFYLQLDKDNIPLVIDQPEDNLDNDSIFSVLAECIRQAKKDRQIILVTHNPNLAVCADAEQIIYVKLEKAKKYKFSYESGAIENPNINDKIVLILEGSQKAFVKRRLKYGI